MKGYHGNGIPSGNHPFAPFYWVVDLSIAHGAWRTTTVRLLAGVFAKDAQRMLAFRNPVAAY